MYDPSFLGVYGRLRQQETHAAAERRAGRRKAKPRRWYSPLSWRSAMRVRRDRFGRDAQPDLGMSIALVCVREESYDAPIGVLLEPGPPSDRDILEF